MVPKWLPAPGLTRTISDDCWKTAPRLLPNWVLATPGGLPKSSSLENTSSVHHVVVCTLCSCYPWSVLGLPPNWYKSYAYRSRVVREPRAVLREFDLDLPDSVEIRVWDSNSDLRYMVLPERPVGTEDHTEEQARFACHARLNDRRGED